MPFIRFLVSKCRAYMVTLILSLGVIIPMCSYYTEKKLVCVIIAAPFGRQPSSCSKCIKLNICSSCNIKSVSNAKYVFLAYLASC